MAVNISRSLNTELGEGMVDGKYKKVDSRERGGVIDPVTHASRQHLNDIWYGVNTEAHVKVRPDGKRSI